MSLRRILACPQNPKYFPGVDLGPNVRAVATLEEAVQGADLLVFCTPHQFMKGICKQLLGKVGRGVREGRGAGCEGSVLWCYCGGLLAGSNARRGTAGWR